MKRTWNIGKIIGLLLGIAALICIITSVIQEGSNIFLNIGLVCNCIALILFMFMNKKEK